MCGRHDCARCTPLAELLGHRQYSALPTGESSVPGAWMLQGRLPSTTAQRRMMFRAY
jgi:hypothetical protein